MGMKKFGTVDRSVILATLSLGAGLAATPALCQAVGEPPRSNPSVKSDERTGDIVVTATRREARLLDIPLSIQAVSGDELTRQGAVNFADYARTVAGVAFLDEGPGRAQIFIRGVSTGGDVDTGKEATVGVYIDETPVTEGSSQPDLRLYDIDRVEVLRGPQGTLFGSGSLGGTLRIITNQPQFDRVAGSFELLGSATKSGGINGAGNAWLNVPLSNTLALRAVGYGLHNSGFLDNGFSGKRNINDEDTYGGRVAIRAKPADALNITLTGFYQETHAGAYNRVTDRYPDLIIKQSAAEPFKDQYGIINLRADLDLGFATLTSSSSYFDRRRRYDNDIDYFLEANFGIPRGYSPLTYDVTSKVQEIRLTSPSGNAFRWLGGVFYLDREENFQQTINLAGSPPAPTQGDNLYFAATATQTRQVAGFAEVSYDLVPSLTATAGLRVSRTRRSIQTTRDGLVFGGLTTFGGGFRETSTTPKFNISYKLTSDALFYVQAAKGFRIGGVNPGLPPCGVGCLVNVGDTFASDSLWNYEVGAKAQAFDRHLTLTASAFRIDWKNIQLNVDRGDGFNGFLNAGNARSQGLEVEARGWLGVHVTLGGQVTYTDATLRSIASGVANVAAPGTRLPQIARWSASTNAQWQTNLSERSSVFVRGDLQYVGPRRNDLSLTPLPLDAYVLLNIRVGLNSGPYAFALFATNVTDERAQLNRNLLNGVRDGAPLVLDRYTVNTPRTIGISVARKF